MAHSDYINKEVKLNYNKTQLKFNLSQALFSSYSIDSGTNMLLKTIVKERDLKTVQFVYDVGCGVGIIGLALKKSINNIEHLVLQDRDVLAVEFSLNNGKLNSLDNIEFISGLALSGIDNRKFDLIVSNIPAKAGEKVIIDFLSRGGSFLTKHGICCVVIVSSLANFAQSTLEDAGCDIVYKESNKQYSVFHYKGFSREYKETFSTYIRNTQPFYFDDYKYNMDTVYNIPDFNSLSFSTSLGMAMLSSYKIKGRVMYVNPGQGHIPVYMSMKNENDIKEFYVASRDVLQNKITSHNLKNNSFNNNITQINIPYIDSLLGDIEENYLNFIGIEIEAIPKANWWSMVLYTPKKLLKAGGYLFILGKSSPMYTLLKTTKGFTPIEDKKFRGFRGVLFKKN